MKKILFFLLLVVALLPYFEAKKNYQSEQQEDSQIQHYRRRSSKNTQNTHKSPRSHKHKKHQNHQPNHQHSHQHHYLHWQQPAFWWNTLLAVFLSCAGGFFSGMTVGLNSLDKLTLEVQKITGNEEQKQRASRILNTISDHHLFLVTLLIGNAMVLEYLPLVVHKLMPDWAAILMSTFAVVIVAEIVPMSYTTGPSKYKVAYTCTPLVDLCIKVYWLISYPIARGLDRLLGAHDTTHIKRNDFLAFVNDRKENHLKPLEITMFNQLFVGPSFISVQKIMMPIHQVMVLTMDDELTQELSSQIIQSEVEFILIAKNSKESHNFNLLTAIKAREFARSFLKKKLQLKKRIIKISQFLQPSFLIDSVSVTSKEQAQKHNENQKIPVVYSDTGLLDLLGIMRTKKSSVALVHKDKRLNQTTSIAFLEASDFQVLYNPFGDLDKHAIVGVVMIDNIFEKIIDMNNEMTPQFQDFKQGTSVKKRKLVKKASIVSGYSVRSQRPF